MAGLPATLAPEKRAPAARVFSRAPGGMLLADRACAGEAGDALLEVPLLTWSFCRQSVGRDYKSRLVRLFFCDGGPAWASSLSQTSDPDL
jgi:hypothetical protein